MTKEDRDKELHGINQRRIDLGDLVVKLGSFIGGGESVKKAIKNAIKACFDTNPHLKNALNDVYSSHVSNLSESVKSGDKAGGTGVIDQLKKKVSDKIAKISAEIEQLQQQNSLNYNSLPSPSSSADPAKLQSKLEALEKVKELCEKYEKLETSNDNPKNLLDNLCNGLQTFLGYDKDSKGYDGTGIVYSDLDRLCDAVMGFLLKCLQGSETLLTHYNDKIPSIIQALKFSIGKGRGVSGFAQVIGRVKDGLQGYEGELSRRCQKVIDDVTAIQSNIGNLNTQFKDMHDRKLSGQLAAISQHAKFFVTMAEKTNIDVKELDEGPRNRLEKSLSLVKQGADNFKNVTVDPSVKTQANEVDTALAVQYRKLDEAINNGARRVERRLNEDFDKMNNELTYLKDVTLTHQMVKMRDAVDAASDLMDVEINDFDAKYTCKIEQQFDDLETYMKEITLSGGVPKRSTLYNAVNKLTGMLNEMEQEIQRGACRIGETINSAVEGVAGALRKLDEKVQQDLGTLVGEIKLCISGYVSNVVKLVIDGAKQAKTDNLFGGIVQTPGVNSIKGANLEGKLSEWIMTLDADGKKTLEGVLHAIRIFSKLDSVQAPSADKLGITTSLSTAIHDEVEGEFNAAHKQSNNVQGRMKNYKQWVTGRDEHSNADPHSLFAKIGDIRTELLKFFKTAITGHNDKFDLTSDASFGSYDATKKEAETAIVDIVRKIDKLEQLPGALDEAKRASRKQLETLYFVMENIDNKIRAIYRAVEEANEHTQDAIASIQQTLATAQQQAQQGIHDLQQSLTRTVQSAFQTLTSQVQSLFAKQKQAELSALESVVTEQLAEMERVIEEDRQSGVKGYLTILKEDFVANLIESQLTDKTFTGLAFKYLTVFNPLFEYVDDQLFPRKPGITAASQSGPTDPHITMIRNISTEVNVLLRHLTSTQTKNYNFSHTFRGNLEALIHAVQRLKTVKFGEGNHPMLLNIIKDGMTDFCKELKYAYINSYDGSDMVVWKAVKADEFVTTESAMKCAKICMSAMPILYDALIELKSGLEKSGNTWRRSQMYVATSNSAALHQLFFRENGYDIRRDTEINRGELNHKDGYSSQSILDHLTKGKNKLFSAHRLPGMSGSDSDSEELTVEVVTDEGLIPNIYGYLKTYFTVCHLTHLDKPRAPCSVYEMLAWCCGLRFNSVYGPLCAYFKELFKKPKDQENKPYKNIDPSNLSLVGTITIQPLHLVDALHDVCSQSYALLTGILGHGHAAGVYACEFPNNRLGLQYPTVPSQCFDMLCDILHRLYQQLYFLYSQCSNDESCAGWLNCWYGNQVGGSHWKCNTMQCPNQKGNQIHKQMCSQKCDQTADCGIKSPLQSFLEDGLQGFLPHSFTKPGCKLTCTLSNHRGIPCRTPMGFADISVAASHRQRGEYLKNVLEDFCGKTTSPLTTLCAQLTCLLQNPPQTLGDIFAFYYSYLNDWADDFYGHPKQKQPYTRQSFNDAVTAANFGKPYLGLNPRILVSSSNHGQIHTKGDLFTISDCTSGSAVPCGLYVKSVTQEISKYYSSEHKANHLSCIVYITETFYDLLKKLYDDCCNKCGPTGSKCYTKSCDEKCSVKYTTDKTEQVSAVSTEHQPTCKSIVTCRDTHPTLYKYGFTFGNAITLNGSRGNTGAKRTCKDFCEALKKMLGDGCVLIELRKQIDAFLWTIRTPFTYLVLSLWLLSLLYLIHIMIIRLDLLHIKSHLHSPSSHRIAAQSLLAAGRVSKLNSVFYLQP